jgi:molybdenum cofactor cytidylyltransferase
MSSRMGEAKQLLRLGQNTLLDQVVEIVCGSKAHEIVLVLGHQAETIQKQLAIKNLKIVINESYQRGMGTSLRTGLAALSPETNSALIVLADQPFVHAETLDQLIDRYEQSGAQIAIPVYKGFRGNPVLLDRSVFPEVMALTGDIGCRAIHFFENLYHRISGRSEFGYDVWADFLRGATAHERVGIDSGKCFGKNDSSEGAIAILIPGSSTGAAWPN